MVDAIAALGRALSVKQGGADKHAREILSSAVELFSSLDTSRGMDLSAAIRALDVQKVKLIEQPGRAGAALDDIFVIRKATAEALKKVTPEVLSAALAGTGLTAKEIAGADAPEKDAEVKAPREAADDAEPPLRVAGR